MNGRPFTMSGHTRGIRSGRRSSSARAQRTQGRFTADGPGLASSGIALVVSLSGEIANLVAARSATSSSSTSSMPPSISRTRAAHQDLAPAKP